MDMGCRFAGECWCQLRPYVHPCSGQRALSWEDLWALLADDEVRVAQLLGMPKVKVQPDFANRGFQRGVETQQSQPVDKEQKEIQEGRGDALTRMLTRHHMKCQVFEDHMAQITAEQRQLQFNEILRRVSAKPASVDKDDSDRNPREVCVRGGACSQGQRRKIHAAVGAKSLQDTWLTKTAPAPQVACNRDAASRIPPSWNVPCLFQVIFVRRKLSLSRFQREIHAGGIRMIWFLSLSLSAAIILHNH